MTIAIAYKIPFLARALRQRDEARKLLGDLRARELDASTRLIVAEGLLHLNSSEKRDEIGNFSPAMTQADPATSAWKVVREPILSQDARVALYVCFVKADRVAPHASFAMKSLKADGFYVICIAVRKDFDACLVDPGPEVADAVCARRNTGWDFGAWAATLKHYPKLWESRGLLLMNDSIMGPLRPITNLWDHIDTWDEAVIGMTESIEIRRHLQSYWIYYKREALQNVTIRAFWQAVRNIDDKDEVITSYELATISLCELAGLSCRALFPFCASAGRAMNPSVFGWRQLLSRGFPFIKVNLLRNPPEGVDVSNWVAEISAAGLDGNLAQTLYDGLVGT